MAIRDAPRNPFTFERIEMPTSGLSTSLTEPLARSVLEAAHAGALVESRAPTSV